jgi:hypothetical protein
MTILKLLGVTFGLFFLTTLTFGILWGINWIKKNYSKVYEYWFIGAAVWLFGRIGIKAFGYEPFLPLWVFLVAGGIIIAHGVVFENYDEDHFTRETKESK